uniref:5'-deoxynucleotidase n=1 Tax=Spongospora subterranea TaxID=70186 RepID=A0A0H5R6Q2_9EUKA|eukprot:CRZ09795.1 hypothetical protein [Spongospora subterranea]
MSAKLAAHTVLDFMLICGRLKTTKRAGWVRKRVHLPESISDHMYRMGMLSMVLGSDHGSKINSDKCVKMSIVHDLAEAIVGDITPFDGVSNEDKYNMELAAMEKITEPLGQCGAQMLELWKEYSEGKTTEAVLVKDIDKLEMVIQAFEYERDQQMNLNDFFLSTKGKFVLPSTNAIAERIYEIRGENQNTNK